MKFKLDSDVIKNISLFESLSGATPKDCFTQEDTITFVVPEAEMGKAIGKNGANIKKLQSMLKKKVVLLEHSDDAKKFILNMIKPATAEILDEGEKIIIQTPDTKTKGFIMGREKTKLAFLESLVKKYFNGKQVVVS